MEEGTSDGDRRRPPYLFGSVSDAPTFVRHPGHRGQEITPASVVGDDPAEQNRGGDVSLASTSFDFLELKAWQEHEARGVTPALSGLNEPPDAAGRVPGKTTTAIHETGPGGDDPTSRGWSIPGVQTARNGSDPRLEPLFQLISDSIQLIIIRTGTPRGYRKRFVGRSSGFQNLQRDDEIWKQKVVTAVDENSTRHLVRSGFVGFPPRLRLLQTGKIIEPSTGKQNQLTIHPSGLRLVRMEHLDPKVGIPPDVSRDLHQDSTLPQEWRATRSLHSVRNDHPAYRSDPRTGILRGRWRLERRCDRRNPDQNRDGSRDPEGSRRNGHAGMVRGSGSPAETISGLEKRSKDGTLRADILSNPRPSTQVV